MFATTLVLIPLIILGTGLVLLAVGLRGRRVDDHPICRRCGFDLFGRPEGSDRCAECGAEVTRSRAVRIGRREKRRGLLALAVPLLLLSVGWFGLLGWGQARGVDWNRHKPAWWLSQDAGNGNLSVRDAALSELVRRVREGTLDADRERALVARALEHQADWDQPWVRGWGELMEAARAAGRLPDDDWKRYVLQSATFTLEPYRVPGRGTFRLRLCRGPHRCASRRGFSLVYAPGLHVEAQLNLGGRVTAVTLKDEHGGLLGWQMMSGPDDWRYNALFGESESTPGEAVASIPLGRGEASPAAFAGPPRRAKLSIELRLLRIEERQTSFAGFLDFLPEPQTRKCEVETTLTSLPLPRLSRDSSLRRRVEKSMWAWRAKLTVRDSESASASAQGPLSAQILFKGAPVDLAFDVFFRPVGSQEEFRARRGYFIAKGVTQSINVVSERDDYGPLTDQTDRVDIILRPNPTLAPAISGEIWGEEVVLRNIRVWEFAP